MTAARTRAVSVVAEALHSISCADDECDGGDMGSYESDAEAVVAALEAEMGLRTVQGAGPYFTKGPHRLVTDWQEDEG